MTNREWLATLSDDDFVTWLELPFHIGNIDPTRKEIMRSSTQSDARLLEWLKENHQEKPNLAKFIEFLLKNCSSSTETHFKELHVCSDIGYVQDWLDSVIQYYYEHQKEIDEFLKEEKK